MNIEPTSFVVPHAISVFLCVKISAVAKLKQMFCPQGVWSVWHGLWFSTNKQQIDDAMLSFWGRFFRSLNRFKVKSTMINVFLNLWRIKKEIH